MAPTFALLFLLFLLCKALDFHMDSFRRAGLVSRHRIAPLRVDSITSQYALRQWYASESCAYYWDEIRNATYA